LRTLKFIRVLQRVCCASVMVGSSATCRWNR